MNFKEIQRKYLFEEFINHQILFYFKYEFIGFFRKLNSSVTQMACQLIPMCGVKDLRASIFFRNLIKFTTFLTDFFEITNDNDDAWSVTLSW